MRLATRAVADVVGSSSPLDAWRSGLAARMSLPVAARQFGGKFHRRRAVAGARAFLRGSVTLGSPHWLKRGAR